MKFVTVKGPALADYLKQRGHVLHGFDHSANPPTFDFEDTPGVREDIRAFGSRAFPHRSEKQVSTLDDLAAALVR